MNKETEQLLNPVMASIQLTTIVKVSAILIYELGDGSTEIHVNCQPFSTEEYSVEAYFHGDFSEEELNVYRSSFAVNKIIKLTGDYRFFAGEGLILYHPTVEELEPPVAMELKRFFRKIRVWMDDVRSMPATFDEHIRTAPEAIALLESGCVKSISLDHDLGDEKNGTGYDVAVAIERGAHDGTIPPLKVCIHSANPVGRKNMTAAITNAKKYWASEVEV